MMQISTGEQACCFGLTVTTEIQNLRGQMMNEVCHLEVECTGDNGCAQATHFHQGDQIFLYGRLRFVQTQDPMTGRRRSHLVIRGEQVQPVLQDLPQTQVSYPVQQQGYPSACVQEMPPCADPMSAPFE